MFPSGGYNLKVGAGSRIELMKNDMGGAAAVLGAAKALGEIRPFGVEVSPSVVIHHSRMYVFTRKCMYSFIMCVTLQVHFIVAACENMISAEGMRPGDIVTASNGKTIEVNNTDAEGRLTLADALIYACNQGVEKVLIQRCYYASVIDHFNVYVSPDSLIEFMQIIDLATLTGAIMVALGPSVAGIFVCDSILCLVHVVRLLCLNFIGYLVYEYRCFYT